LALVEIFVKMTDQTAPLRGLQSRRRTTAEWSLMATTPMNQVIQHLLATCGRDGMTDGELLTRFLSGRDDYALAVLIGRHGPMVWGVCCRLLRNPHDAEDAFQATFLVLVQKANTLPDPETVGNWLYGVAHQTAVRMRAMVAKRGVRERQVAVMPEPVTAEQYVWNDLSPVVDEELSRLPDKYRVLIVLCDLEDVTRKEVARRLGIPEGTAASRLAAARALLAKRLARRGFVVSGGLLGAVLPQQGAWASVPTAAVSSTIKAAGSTAAGQAAIAGAVSTTVATLAEGVLKAMFVTKIKSAAAVLLFALLSVAGASTLAFLPGAAGQQPPAAEKKAVKQTAVDKAEPPGEPVQPDPKKFLSLREPDQNDWKKFFGLPVEEDTKVSKEPPGAKGAAAKKLEGVWTVVSVKDAKKNTLDSDPLFSHVAVTQTPARNVRLTLQAGKITLKSGPVSLEGVYKVDTSTVPEQITLTFAHRPGMLLSIPGIYTLDGDNLTVTFVIPPSEAARLAENLVGVFYTLKREAQPKTDAAWPQPPAHPPGVGKQATDKAEPLGDQARKDYVKSVQKRYAENEMQKQLEGSWQCVSLQPNPDKVYNVSEVVHTFKGDEWNNNLGREVPNFGTYKLVDLDASPKQIDLLCVLNESESRTLEGIFMLDGDSLVMCFSADGRPKSFEGNPYPTMKFKRQPPKPEISIFDPFDGEVKEVVVKEMQKRLEGSWKCVSTHANGGRDVSDVIHTIKGDAWDNTLGLRVVNRGTYKLVNLNTTPKQIDYVYEAGESKGKTLKGIFMLDGDSLIVAFGADARPQVFFTEKGDPDTLVVRQFRRQQP
jgi:RNA polymerase sigma factor (sigma-70 family)